MLLYEFLLDQLGCDIIPCYDGLVAWKELNKNSDTVDLIISDIHMPNMDGREFAKRVRANHEFDQIPLIMSSTVRELHEIKSLLHQGANDYVTKPFSTTELMARVRAVLRRIRPALVEDKVVVGDIVVDRTTHTVSRNGEGIHLGPTEFRLLDYFIQHPGRVFSREQLLDGVWGSDVYVEARTVDVHVGRLRKALMSNGGDDPIRTVRSAGYSLRAN